MKKKPETPVGVSRIYDGVVVVIDSNSGAVSIMRRLGALMTTILELDREEAASIGKSLIAASEMDCEDDT